MEHIPEWDSMKLCRDSTVVVHILGKDEVEGSIPSHGSMAGGLADQETLIRFLAGFDSRACHQTLVSKRSTIEEVSLLIPGE